MEDKIIVQLLIHFYENLIYRLELRKYSEFSVLIDYLRECHASNGICHLLKQRFFIDAQKLTWINQYADYRGYWGVTPEKVDSYERIMHCIELRLNILKNIKF